MLLSSVCEATKPNRYQFWVDLDGVLVDFDAGVKTLTGRLPSKLQKSELWDAVNKAPAFFEDLDWMADGRLLWNTVKQFKPTILTGLPRGSGEQQKRNWCARHLGANIPVVVCRSKDKRLYATATGILIDDRVDNIHSWIAAGGIGILHKSTKQTLQELAIYVQEL